MNFPAVFASSHPHDATVHRLDYCIRPPADTSAIHHTSCSPQGSVPSERSDQDILQTILRTRKTWKTLKGQAEAVWPPYLEAVMLKALQEYEPEDSRETRILGRYPMRNRFISEYIHRTTGKFRSAKQVGSRLQQLRDTIEGRELIDSLTRCYHTRAESGAAKLRVPVDQPSPCVPSSSPQKFSISWELGSWGSSSPSPSASSSSTDSLVTLSDYSPLMSHPSPRLRNPQPGDQRTPVYIDILPEQPRWSSPFATSSPGYAQPASSSTRTASSNFRASESARRMRDIDPTVTFVSPSPVNGKSSYIVLLDGAPVHSEDTKLEYVGPYFSSPPNAPSSSSGSGPVLYNTPLVPQYWDVLCSAADPTLYTIIQDVYRAPDLAPTQGFSTRPRPVLIFSAIYHFQYPASSPTNSSSSSGGGSESRLHSPVVASKPESRMTSAFDQPDIFQDILNPIRPMPFQKYSMYASQGQAHPTHSVPPPPLPSSQPPHQTLGNDRTLRSFSSPGMTDQNGFDEPFMLDVDFEDFRFDDFTIHVQDSPENTTPTSTSASSYFPNDMNAYYQ